MPTVCPSASPLQATFRHAAPEPTNLPGTNGILFLPEPMPRHAQVGVLHRKMAMEIRR